MCYSNKRRYAFHPKRWKGPNDTSSVVYTIEPVFGLFTMGTQVKTLPMIFIFDKNHALGSQYIRLYILNKGDNDYYDILALRLLFSSFALMFENGSFVDMTRAAAVVSKVLSAVPIVLMVLPIVSATVFPHPDPFQTFEFGMACGWTASLFFREAKRHSAPAVRRFFRRVRDTCNAVSEFLTENIDIF